MSKQTKPKIGQVTRMDDIEEQDVKVINPFDPQEVEKEDASPLTETYVTPTKKDYIDMEMVEPDTNPVKKRIIHKVAGTPYERLTLIRMSIKNLQNSIQKKKEELSKSIQQEKKLLKIIDQLENL